MSEERDFDWVRGKVPRYNQDGDDISDEDLGAGGRRREDGKIAGLAYDLEYYDPDEDNDGEEDSSTDSSYVSQNSDNNADDRFAEGAIAGAIAVAALYGGYKAVKWAAPKIMQGSKKAVSFIKKKLHLESDDVEVEFVEKIAEPETSAIIVPDLTDLDAAYEEYHRDMSSEEIQRHLVNIAVHYMAIMNELKQLYGVRVTRDDWDEAIAKLIAPENIAVINQLLGNNPALLEDTHAKTLSSILNREVIVEGEYVPVYHDELTKAFRVVA